MTEEQKKWIDTSTYEVLLSRWRFAALGDPMFVGECGEYYKKVMAEKRDRCQNAQMVSKNVGWLR